MSLLLNIRKPLAGLLLLAFTCLTVPWTSAQGAMVGTAQILVQKPHELDRERLRSFLDRTEVRAQLEAWGLDSEIAKARIDSLTDEEVAEIVGRLDQLPAGGDALGVIVSAVVIIFLVLLVTDILGFTDIFPFVRKHR